MLSPRAAVEAFHLSFLRGLASRAEDKSLIALKGGSNLRFYFGSARYSEDVDLDVVTIAKGTLKNKVERLLEGPLVAAPLRALGVTIVEHSAPKQTETTQRWKVGLRVEGASLEIRTKIEFSRRDAIAGAAFEATDKDVARAYRMPPVLATHYAHRAAMVQKIHALAARTESQARDVFDLAHLMARPSTPLVLDVSERAWLEPAIEHAMGISFDDYAAGVLAYLDPVHAAPFEGREAWNELSTRAVEELERLR